MHVFIELPSGLEAALISSPLPEWELDGFHLAGDAIQRYQSELAAAPRFEEATAGGPKGGGLHHRSGPTGGSLGPSCD